MARLLPRSPGALESGARRRRSSCCVKAARSTTPCPGACARCRALPPGLPGGSRSRPRRRPGRGLSTAAPGLSPPDSAPRSGLRLVERAPSSKVTSQVWICWADQPIWRAKTISALPALQQTVSVSRSSAAPACLETLGLEAMRALEAWRRHGWISQGISLYTTEQPAASSRRAKRGEIPAHTACFDDRGSFPTVGGPALWVLSCTLAISYDSAMRSYLSG